MSKAVNETKDDLLYMTVREYFGQVSANLSIYEDEQLRAEKQKRLAKRRK